MSVFKKLNKADIVVTPYIANKNWYLPYNDVFDDTFIISYEGSNIPYNPNISINGQNSTLIYKQINHLFYQRYNDLLNTGSLLFDVNTYESASQQRPTSSYFNYNTNPNFINNFPTESGDKINVISINQNIFGSKILPHTFQISGSNNGFIIKDDGNGNLFDIIPSSSIHVGNIFYSHGLIVITNQDYNGFDFYGDVYFQNEHIIYENEIRCIVKENDYNLSYNPTLVTGSYTNGILKDFTTGSDFQPYVTTIGLYNDENELLAVAKLGKPMVLSADTDMTFIIKYDT